MAQPRCRRLRSRSRKRRRGSGSRSCRSRARPGRRGPDRPRPRSRRCRSWRCSCSPRGRAAAAFQGHMLKSPQTKKGAPCVQEQQRCRDCGGGHCCAGGAGRGRHASWIVDLSLLYVRIHRTISHVRLTNSADRAEPSGRDFRSVRRIRGWPEEGRLRRLLVRVLVHRLRIVRPHAVGASRGAPSPLLVNVPARHPPESAT